MTRAAGSPRAVAVTFALAGVVSAAAFSRVPSLRNGLHATSAQMGLALVCVGAGSLLLMPFTGRLTERYTSRVVIRGVGVLCLAGWAAAAYAPSIPLLALALLVVAFVWKAPGAVRAAAIVLGLVVVQVVLGFAGMAVPFLGALHGLNALFLFGAAVMAGMRVRGAEDQVAPQSATTA